LSCKSWSTCFTISLCLLLSALVSINFIGNGLRDSLFLPVQILVNLLELCFDKENLITYYYKQLKDILCQYYQ
ncbi:MAG: hypothetical protein KF781_11650, partial [Chitinophagaceae bacterium]|nr:hypothetical protein [Chitinophagaceae bacterium]